MIYVVIGWLMVSIFCWGAMIYFKRPCDSVYLDDFIKAFFLGLFWPGVFLSMLYCFYTESEIGKIVLFKGKNK